jgi:hypothetical protein
MVRGGGIDVSELLGDDVGRLGKGEADPKHSRRIPRPHRHRRTGDHRRRSAEKRIPDLGRIRQDEKEHHDDDDRQGKTYHQERSVHGVGLLRKGQPDSCGQA